MSFDSSTYRLFEPSNFDPYDSGEDRYPAALKEGLRQHGLDLSDVLAVTQDMGLWAICIEPSGPKTRRIVLRGPDGRELARMDFSAGGMDNTPELAAAHCQRIYRILQQAMA